jgi:hypothetical protein
VWKTVEKGGKLASFFHFTPEIPCAGRLKTATVEECFDSTKSMNTNYQITVSDLTDELPTVGAYLNPRPESRRIINRHFIKLPNYHHVTGGILIHNYYLDYFTAYQ